MNNRLRKLLILYYADLDRRVAALPAIKIKVKEPKMKIGKRRRKKIQDAVRKVRGK